MDSSRDDRYWPIGSLRGRWSNLRDEGGGSGMNRWFRVKFFFQTGSNRRQQVFCDSFDQVPRRILLDIDDTKDRVHGGQQLALWNAHYDSRAASCRSTSTRRRAVSRSPSSFVPARRRTLSVLITVSERDEPLAQEHPYRYRSGWRRQTSGKPQTVPLRARHSHTVAEGGRRTL